MSKRKFLSGTCGFETMEAHAITASHRYFVPMDDIVASDCEEESEVDALSKKPKLLGYAEDAGTTLSEVAASTVEATENLIPTTPTVDKEVNTDKELEHNLAQMTEAKEALEMEVMMLGAEKHKALSDVEALSATKAKLEYDAGILLFGKDALAKELFASEEQVQTKESALRGVLKSMAGLAQEKRDLSKKLAAAASATQTVQGNLDQANAVIHIKEGLLRSNSLHAPPPRSPPIAMAPARSRIASPVSVMPATSLAGTAPTFAPLGLVSALIIAARTRRSCRIPATSAFAARPEEAACHSPSTCSVTPSITIRRSDRSAATIQ